MESLWGVLWKILTPGIETLNYHICVSVPAVWGITGHYIFMCYYLGLEIRWISGDELPREPDKILRLIYPTFGNSLQWCHNGLDGISNHQPHHCLLNRLFGRRSKKTSKFRVTGLCVGNSPGTGEFPAQMASNAENVSIWWRHHVIFHTVLQWLSQNINQRLNLKQISYTSSSWAGWNSLNKKLKLKLKVLCWDTLWWCVLAGLHDEHGCRWPGAKWASGCHQPSCWFHSELNATSPKWKCHHFDEIFITGCTGSCHFWQLPVQPVMKILSKWWHFHTVMSHLAHHTYCIITSKQSCSREMGCLLPIDFCMIGCVVSSTWEPSMRTDCWPDGHPKFMGGRPITNDHLASSSNED